MSRLLGECIAPAAQAIDDADKLKVNAGSRFAEEQSLESAHDLINYNVALSAAIRRRGHLEYKIAVLWASASISLKDS